MTASEQQKQRKEANSKQQTVSNKQQATNNKQHLFLAWWLNGKNKRKSDTGEEYAEFWVCVQVFFVLQQLRFFVDSCVQLHNHTISSCNVNTTPTRARKNQPKQQETLFAVVVLCLPLPSALPLFVCVLRAKTRKYRTTGETSACQSKVCA